MLFRSNQGQSHQFMAQLEADLSRLVIAGVVLSGPRLFVVEQSSQGVRAEASDLVPPQIRPEYLLADLQLAFAPREALERAYAGTEWSLFENSDTRVLRQRGRDVAVVHRGAADPWAAPVDLTNHRYGYALHVETLERQ